MANTAYQLLKTLKSASSLYGGGGAQAFKPVEPFPNSIAAKQMEQQEIAADAANSPENQLQQTQKAQQDAVKELQQAQQQIQQLQGELQNAQATSQQQAQQAEMQAQQEIQKAQMDAQYELQAEKIKNQKAMLSMQEKYMKGMQKQPKDQGGILGNQLKRVVNKVNKMANFVEGEFIDMPKAAGQNIQVQSPGTSSVAMADNSANSAMKANPVRSDAERAARRQKYSDAMQQMEASTPAVGGGQADLSHFSEFATDPSAYMSNKDNYNRSLFGDMIGEYSGDQSHRSVLGNMTARGLHGFAKFLGGTLDAGKNFIADTGTSALGAVSNALQGIGHGVVGALSKGGQLANYGVNTLKMNVMAPSSQYGELAKKRDEAWNKQQTMVDKNWNGLTHNFRQGIADVGNYGSNMLTAAGAAAGGPLALTAGAPAGGPLALAAGAVGALHAGHFGPMFSGDTTPQGQTPAAPPSPAAPQMQQTAQAPAPQATQPNMQQGQGTPQNMLSVLQRTGYQMGPHFAGLPSQAMEQYRGPAAYENVKNTLFGVAPMLGLPDMSIGRPDYGMFYNQ